MRTTVNTFETEEATLRLRQFEATFETTAYFNGNVVGADRQSFFLQDGTKVGLIGLRFPENGKKLTELMPHLKAVKYKVINTREGIQMAEISNHNDTDLNKWFLSRGFAEVDGSNLDAAHLKQYQAAENEARAAKLGIWKD